MNVARREAGWIRRWLDARPAPPKAAKPWGVELSYSQVRTYLDCPWLYKLRYEDGWRTAWTPASSLGVSIHRALERFHRLEPPAGESELSDAYEAGWLGEGYASASEQMEWHAKGGEILRAYWAAESGRPARIVAVEREFAFPLEAHTVRGMIDRIDRRPDGSIEIIDYKTHLDLVAEDEVARDLQLRTYALGARECLGLEPAWLTLYYVAAGRRISVPYDPSGEAEVRELFARIADLISHGKSFTPDTTHCPSCPLRLRCAYSTAKEP